MVLVVHENKSLYILYSKWLADEYTDEEVFNSIIERSTNTHMCYYCVQEKDVVVMFLPLKTLKGP